ncbi:MULTISPECIES: hypothetical protein [unclassified Streptomyces]|uniref:hypothetical protein n=1 Tax=unclassified Streptomyces TaxID=2593676 RepID=UPI0033D6EF83
MKSLVVQIVVTVAAFCIVLLALGSGFGVVELGIWGIAQVALIVFVVQRFSRGIRAFGNP